MTLFAEDEFWVLQSNRSGGFLYRRIRVPGRQFREPSKGFRKGKGAKGKGKSRPDFQSMRGRLNMTQDANSMYGKGKKGKKVGKSKGKGKG